MILLDTPVALMVCSYHWPNGIMYYTIDAAFSTSERAVIASGEVLLSAGNCAQTVSTPSSGMQHVEDNSCIRFVERTDQVLSIISTHICNDIYNI